MAFRDTLTMSSWFKSKPLWVQGGLIGVLTCFLLAVFYVTFYNLLLNSLYPDGMLPVRSLFLPIATGHFFVWGAPFVAKGYVAPMVGCMSGDCFDRVDWITLIGTAILLLLLYFGIGAGMGWFIEKRKKKVTSSSPLSP